MTPFQNITRTVGRLTKVSDLLDVADLRNVLTGVMDSLSTENLYAPSRQILDSLGVDEMTKNYLLYSFASDADGDKSKKENNDYRKSQSLRNLKELYDEKGKLEQMREEVEHSGLLWQINSVEFTVFDKHPEEMNRLIVMMYDGLGLLEEFDIPMESLMHFSRSVMAQYVDNPYHNFKHAFDVAQMCYFYVTKSKAGKFLTKTDMLALITSALCHDLSHPGTTNSFQINAETELALVYNDTSVLENFHCSKAFGLLKQEKNNILANLTLTEFKEVRKMMIAAILSTDMTVHFELSSKFSTHVDAKASENNKDMFSKDIKDRQLLVNILLHSADISNMVRPYAISRQWSDRVFEEFLKQVTAPLSPEIPIYLLG